MPHAGLCTKLMMTQVLISYTVVPQCSDKLNVNAFKAFHTKATVHLNRTKGQSSYQLFLENSCPHIFYQSINYSWFSLLDHGWLFQADAYSKGLLSLGVKRGDVLALTAFPSSECVALCVAAVSLGLGFAVSTFIRLELFWWHGVYWWLWL